MGSTRWSDEHYAARASYRTENKVDTFGYHTAVTTGKAAAKVHDKLDALNAKSVVTAAGTTIKGRECRDSDTHPTTVGVATVLDVTGSMSQVPKIVQQNLPKLMGLLQRKGYLEHPQILTMAIGDASGPDPDKYPLQVGQFEAGIEIEDDLTKLILEGGGGGQKSESYELGFYFLADHTVLDCHEKRGKKGYAFFIGDEMPYTKVNKDQIKRLIGTDVQDSEDTAAVVERLKAKYECYFILPALTSHYNDTEVIAAWEKLFGVERILKLQDAASICELIASVIGVAEGVADLEEVESDLTEAGASDKTRSAVGKAISKMTSGGKIAKRAKGTDIAVKESDAPSGIATL